MFFANRQHSIRDVASGAEAAKLLLRDGGQSLCFGLRLGPLLLLNDSLTSDPTRHWEYAVMLVEAEAMAVLVLALRACTSTFALLSVRQVESVTVSSYTDADLAAEVDQLAAGVGHVNLGYVRVHVHALDERCGNCA